MAKKRANTVNSTDSGAPVEVLDPETPTESASGTAEVPLTDEEMAELEEAMLEEESEPAPRPQRGRKKKSRSISADAGPLSLCDVVNSPEANDAWWQEHRLVIYRKDVSKDMKALMKADSGRTWIDRITGPFTQEEFDESYLRSHYGGGLFSVFLQEKPTGGNKWGQLLDCEFVIAGPAKFTDEEAAAARRANPNQQQVQAPSGDRGELGVVLDLLQRQIDRADAPQAAALSSLAETMRTGQQASTQLLMDTMKQVMEMRNRPDSGGNDKLIETGMSVLLKQLESKPIQ